jgi:hypothetical protein
MNLVVVLFLAPWFSEKTTRTAQGRHARALAQAPFLYRMAPHGTFFPSLFSPCIFVLPLPTSSFHFSFLLFSFLFFSFLFFSFLSLHLRFPSSPPTIYPYPILSFPLLPLPLSPSLLFLIFMVVLFLQLIK